MAGAAPGSSSIRVLAGVPTSPGVGVGPVIRRSGRGVLVTDDLSPGDVAALDGDEVAALATAAGAPLSHAAILTRSRSIPAVTGLGPELLDVPEGTLVLVDGEKGTVHVEPSVELVEEARARQRAAEQEQHEARRLAAAEARTGDGRVVPVLVNLGKPEDARLAVGEGADGCGMLRTEFAFLDRDQPPTEEEQFQSYWQVAEALGERPLILRTLDLGADIPSWDALPEPNPALGNRGLRLSLCSPELLEPQLKAVVRLAERRPLRVMFPMVTMVDEVRRVRACLDDIVKRSSPGGYSRALEVGITIEVPGAALTADAFTPLVDFFAIGTNDLTQYTLAADRSNAAVAGIADGLHPGVLRLIQQVTTAAERRGQDVVVVGELACDRLGVPVLLGLGVNLLSVRPNAVAAVKHWIRAVDVPEACALAQRALEAESAAAVRALVTAYWKGQGAG